MAFDVFPFQVNFNIVTSKFRRENTEITLRCRGRLSRGMKRIIRTKKGKREHRKKEAVA